MANEFAHLNEEANRSRVLAGLKGGNLFQNPVMLPPLTFGDGIQPEVKAAQTAGPKAPVISTSDPWYSRRGN